MLSVIGIAIICGLLAVPALRMALFVIMGIGIVVVGLFLGLAYYNDSPHQKSTQASLHKCLDKVQEKLNSSLKDDFDQYLAMRERQECH